MGSHLILRVIGSRTYCAVRQKRTANGKAARPRRPPDRGPLDQAPARRLPCVQSAPLLPERVRPGVNVHTQGEDDAHHARRRVAAALFSPPRRSQAQGTESAIKGSPGQLRLRRLRPRIDGLRQPARRRPDPRRDHQRPLRQPDLRHHLGTSNCGTGVFAPGTKNFVEANREVVAKDISRGEGEAIGALTVINSCQDSSPGRRRAPEELQGHLPVRERDERRRSPTAILDTLHGRQEPRLRPG